MYKLFLAVLFVVAAYFGVKNVNNLVFDVPIVVVQHGIVLGITYAILCVMGLAACLVSLYFNCKSKEWRTWGNKEESK